MKKQLRNGYIKLMDLLSDKLQYSLLVEMATEKKELKFDIISNEPKITEHLFYLKLYPESRDINHWKTEINGWINVFCDTTVKPDNRKLKADFYFEYLYNFQYGDKDDSYFEKLYKSITKKEGKSEYELSIDLLSHLNNELKHFYKELSLLCANNKILLDEKIDNLINKWHNKGID